MADKSKASKVTKIIAPAKTVKLAKTAATNIAVVTRKATVGKAVTAKVESPEKVDKAGKPTVKPIGTRAQLIAEHAYFLAAARGFAAGHDLTDWLEAEQTVDGLYRFT